jgi:hypothetical protein
MLKSSRLPPGPYVICVLPNTGLLHSSIRAFVGLGKLLGMNRGGGLLGEVTGCELAILRGVVFVLAIRCVLFLRGVTSSTVVAWLIIYADFCVGARGRGGMGVA